MARLILFNKPFQVMCQFTDREGRPTLADYLSQEGVYPSGRLDYDSEGLLLLTDSGELQHQISHPKHKLTKTYLVQVEGTPTPEQIHQLNSGVDLKDGKTRPARTAIVAAPDWLWPRHPPIRERINIPTSWLKISIQEGRNRQVRRMTAAVGLPTLRLVRISIGNWDIGDLQPGQHLQQIIHPPEPPKARGTPLNRRRKRQVHPPKSRN